MESIIHRDILENNQDGRDVFLAHLTTNTVLMLRITSF